MWSVDSGGDDAEYSGNRQRALNDASSNCSSWNDVKQVVATKRACAEAGGERVSAAMIGAWRSEKSAQRDKRGGGGINVRALHAASAEWRAHAHTRTRR